MTTGFVWHERYMWHDTGSHADVLPAGGMIEPSRHAENPDTKRRFRNLLEVSGLLDQLAPIAPRPASEAEILRFHTPDYLARIKQMSEDPRGGDAGVLTPFGPGSYAIAALSAGGVIAALDAVLTGAVDNAYALVRPPGHHALADSGMGFCLFGNAVIAARHAQAVHGVSRIALVDWDVHHGNGTQSAFWRERDVLTISIHQDDCFPPGSGALEDTGEGEGEGYNINIPLPPGSGVGAYVAAFERVVAPALRAFAPELIIVPCGFDAGAYDPLGRMMMHSDGYRTLTAIMMELAAQSCAGRLVMCHEGGYNAATVPFFGLAVVETLAGVRSGVEDPFMALFGALGGQALQPHQDAAIARAEALVRRL